MFLNLNILHAFDCFSKGTKIWERFFVVQPVILLKVNEKVQSFVLPLDNIEKYIKSNIKIVFQTPTNYLIIEFINFILFLPHDKMKLDLKRKKGKNLGI